MAAHPCFRDPWDPAALRAAGRLAAVFSGASWDRWGRAMEEALADAGVAEACGEFVTQRVNADLRPDVHARLSPAGGPALAVLSPEGLPLVSAGYAPAPVLRDTLRGAALQWHVRRPLLLQQAGAAAAAARALAELRPPPRPADAAFVRSVAEEVAASCDPVHGGWGDGTRRPHPAALRLLAACSRLPGARDALDLTLSRLLASPMRGRHGGFCHASDTPDWSAPDGLELVAELADLHAALALAAAALGRPSFAEAGEGVARRLAGLRRADGLWPVAATADGAAHAATPESSFVAAAALAAPPPPLPTTADGLFPRTPDDPALHLADQAAALEFLAASDPDAARRLAARVRSAFWDDDAAAFRDRAGPPLEPAPLDLPRFPLDANARAAGALARLGGEYAALAARCLASFADACWGQGASAARLALAAPP